MKSDCPILLVEDDEVDVMTVQRAFKKLNIGNPLVIARNGEEALSHLRMNLSNLPGLVLLDIKIPRMNAFEFLRCIKKEKQMKNIPVIILTASDEVQDIKSSFDFGASGYMVKSIDFDQTVDTIDRVYKYWAKSKVPIEVQT